MDTTGNGIAWLGNVYQKFEDMWREVDGIMLQAEKQLETVGANVKKFCSESQLIGDALSQSSEDKEKGAAPELSLVHTDDAACIKSPVGTAEDCDKRSFDDGDNLGSVEFVKSIFSGLSLEEPDETEVRKFQLQMSDRKGLSNSSLLHGFYHASQELELDGGAKMIVPASEDVGGCNSLTETEDRRNNHVDMPANISADIQVYNTVNLVIPSTRSVTDNGAAYLTTTTIEPSPDGIELYDSLEESDSTMSLPVYDSADESKSTMPLPESGSILEEWDNDVTKPGLQTLQLSDKVKLDESCIIVDSSGLECISCEEVKSRSYKKKFRDAFASKTGLLKKQNHKQQADWLTGDLDAGFDQQKRKSSTTTTLCEKSNPPDYDFCESEWEIV